MKKLLLGFVLMFCAFSYVGVQAQETNKTVARTLGCTLEEGQTFQQVEYTDGTTAKLPVKYCVELEESIAGNKSVAGKSSGVELFSNYIRVIYVYGASIMGILCVLIIVVSGIQISMGGANNELVNQGKERIMQAMLSLILLFASALILRTVNPGFFGNGPQPAPAPPTPTTYIESVV